MQMTQVTVYSSGWLKIKRLTGQNAISRQRIEIFYQNFSISAEDFFNSFCKFYRNAFTASRITAFTIFYSVFQNYAYEMDSHLLCSLRVFLKARSNLLSLNPTALSEF